MFWIVPYVIGTFRIAAKPKVSAVKIMARMTEA